MAESGSPKRDKPITNAEIKTILDLHATGTTRNDIARQTGRAQATVTKIVHDAGLSFDRASTEAATKARQADFRSRRAEISDRLLHKVVELLEQMDQPHLAFSFGGRDNTYAEHVLPKPATGDLRNLMQTASTAIGRHIDLERVDTESGAADARSMLGQLGEALGVKPVDE